MTESDFILASKFDKAGISLKEELRMHAFVCVNERDSNNQRGCCSSKNSLEVMTKLKEELGKWELMMSE